MSSPAPGADLLGQLLHPAVSTFLVRGNPGTGKSTLALELLRRKGRGVYVSTRVTFDYSKGYPQASLLAMT